MNPTTHFRFLFLAVSVFLFVASAALPGFATDIRGQWVGDAKGSIFGAKGTVNIIRQNGQDFYGLVEGGNFFGTARFDINGKIRGNYIFGAKEGHSFQGFLYPDGTIRGVFRAVDGDSYRVFLQRPYSYWGMPPGMWPPGMSPR